MLDVTELYVPRCDEIVPPDSAESASPTHSPCFQLYARPAGTIAGPAGRLLPYRFTPDRSYPKVKEAGLFSVAVVVNGQRAVHRPHLLFREATWSTCSHKPTRKSGSSSTTGRADSTRSSDGANPSVILLLSCATSSAAPNLLFV